MTYKGTASQVFELDPNAKASTVRNELKSSGFISEDSASEAWRFFIYDSETTNFSDAILGKEVEALVPISGMFGPGGQLYLTNTRKEKNPDLMGIGTDWFFDRFMSCRVRLNNDEESARAANRGKFEPMHLTHVRPTSTNTPGIYDNVVVCEQGSVITFDVSSWGAAGFCFNIKPDAGETIVDGLYICLGDNPNHVAGSSTRRYSSAAKQIVVNSTSSMQIPSGQWVQYQRVSVQTLRMTSYKKDGRTYSSNAQPPNSIASSTAAPSSRDTSLPRSAELSPRDLARATILPGDSITPGTTQPGADSNQSFGGISNVVTDRTPLGEVVFYFFVFKSREDAVKVIGQINSPNPSVWD
ncbi:hypothetical protein BON30_08845 [Cystobacter ferrugineus]|uniref:Uncharacterized protein n=2 Tax=Cystobacter ferrugineus TaxID=83449 RepID=A0A1L9BFL3_9BACT|nr:hypothetical protein BON30_08845 [Cystobacter ferrugineus]